MHTAARITVVALCLSLAAAVMPLKDMSRDAELSLMRMLTQSRDVSGNPQRSMECFTEYVPQLNNCTERYEQNYKACLSSADEARSLVNNETLSDREILQASAKSTCDTFNECNTYQSALDFFKCYKTTGDVGVKTMFSMSANATEILIDIEESYCLIDKELDRCTNASERAYIEEYSQLFIEMERCTKGETQVPLITTLRPNTTLATNKPTTDDINTEPGIIPSESTTAETIITPLTDPAPTDPERSVDKNVINEEDLYNLTANRLAVTLQKLIKHF